MKIKSLVLVTAILALSACVPKSDYEKLEKEKNEIERQLEETQREYNLLYEEKRQAEIEKNRTPYISEEEALKYIKDNYAFYEKDMKYRNVQLRRIGDNSFRVSLEECTKKGDFSNNDFFWNARVRTLTVHKSGKYDF